MSGDWGMKEPIKWFIEAVNSGNYEKDVITEMNLCISEDGFDVDKFMDWVSEQIEQRMDED
ncbi:MAG: hypothetical protein MIO93_16120 [ANME-2 cluster archaeon]|jgi:hypothetical protein|nr:hypothetical protein [ANME-2 cluster archaeon]